MKHYNLDDPELISVPLPDTMQALDAVGWSAGQKLLIEFPDDVYDAPVVVGVGQRIPNPNFPFASSQRYAFKGSPHESRVPRSQDGTLFVRYMRKKFAVKAYARTHQSGANSVVFKATETLAD